MEFNGGFELDGSLKEWAKDKPLSILQLDPADRAVLRIADTTPLSNGCHVGLSRPVNAIPLDEGGLNK
ncbi:hypothetical protein KQX54_003987 [Cotesia glomerata]|uniref:Uncharacterized protein n=1 Tax=Cotesia glomerata TaxID=32391 RepID=A0AAV7J6I4_COTGL|nr:hypothetical protein KQX54_003987 [Cotesia glomerata]